MKVCSKCGIEKDMNEFNKDRNHKDGRRSHCKACRREYRLANKEKDGLYRLAHKEQEREYCRKYRKKNRDKVNALSAKHRARKLNQTPNLSQEEKFEMQAIYKMAQELGYEVDHIRPISKGGLHHPDNLQIIPAKENRRKSAKLDYIVPEDCIIRLDDTGEIL